MDNPMQTTAGRSHRSNRLARSLGTLGVMTLGMMPVTSTASGLVSAEAQSLVERGAEEEGRGVPDTPARSKETRRPVLVPNFVAGRRAYSGLPLMPPPPHGARYRWADQLPPQTRATRPTLGVLERVTQVHLFTQASFWERVDSAADSLMGAKYVKMEYVENQLLDSLEQLVELEDITAAMLTMALFVELSYRRRGMEALLNNLFPEELVERVRAKFSGPETIWMVATADEVFVPIVTMKFGPLVTSEVPDQAVLYPLVARWVGRESEASVTLPDVVLFAQEVLGCLKSAECSETQDVLSAYALLELAVRVAGGEKEPAAKLTMREAQMLMHRKLAGRQLRGIQCRNIEVVDVDCGLIRVFYDFNGIPQDHSFDSTLGFGNLRGQKIPDDVVLAVYRSCDNGETLAYRREEERRSHPPHLEFDLSSAEDPNRTVVD